MLATSAKRPGEDFIITVEKILLQPLNKCVVPLMWDLCQSFARVAKLVDALVSGARAERCGGSNPFPGTITKAVGRLQRQHQLLFAFKELNDLQTSASNFRTLENRNFIDVVKNVSCKLKT